MDTPNADHRDPLRKGLGDDEALRSLASVRVADGHAAKHRLYRLAEASETCRALDQCLPALLAALSDIADPDRVLVNLERLAHSVTDRHALFQYLAQNPRAIEILVTLFAGSQFLTEILLRNPNALPRLVEYKRLARLKSVGQLAAEAQAALAPYTAVDDQLDALRRFQRWELLRIGACDLLGLLDLPSVTAQLSCLADSLVRVCLIIAAQQTHTAVDGFAVLAMGKLGGGELNYSSDIDLLFIAASQASAYHALGQQLIEALTRVTSEGFLYRVDMRLRPWGTSGALVTSRDGYISYLRRHARLWEKQALLKARVIAGDEKIGNEFLRQAEPLLFNCAREEIRADVRALKQRIEAELRRNGGGWGEVKLGIGSIRDVEFVVQYLQLIHGGQCPHVRSPNTLDALVRLFAAGFLSAADYRVLVDGYTFLRTVEHHLQMMHYRQTHRLPDDHEQLTQLALRLGFEGSLAGARFLTRYQQHTAAIRAVYERYLEAEDPMAPDPPAHPPIPNSYHHLARMDPSYATTFSAEEIRHHSELAERLNDEHLVEVEAIPLDDRRWRVTIVAYDYLGELSLICGLLFVYGFNILDGDIFTYEPATASTVSTISGYRTRRRRPSPTADTRRKIVDVFTVRSELAEIPADIWARYTDDLAALLRELQAGRQREAQGALAKRIATALREAPGTTATLYPVDIEIDNSSSERYTVLHIDAPDTIGFLYEFTNALALNGIYIARVTVSSVGARVRDTLYVTDARGQKIISPNKQRELRAATVLVKHFTRLLPHSPNPELALLHFQELLGQLFARPNWPDELVSLERPEVLEALARLLGVSDFLWDDFLRMQYDNLFPLVRDVGALAVAKPKAQLQAELEAALQAAPDYEARRAALNAFKDREMFRIDMRYILGHITEFGQFSAELSDLAEAVVDAAYRLCHEKLQAQFGTPCLEDGAPCPIAVCGLGKCGGRELGFASDIELMFIYAGNGQTTGPHVITTAEFLEKLVQEFLQTIQAKREGIFEIDLRLRPYGRMGSLAVSLEAFRRYFGPGGPAWAYERQALVKLRPIAGDEALGRQIVALRDEFVYSGEPFDVAAMRAMRERQLRHLVAGGTINAKFSPGGLVDLEYLVQGLQIQHGHRDPTLRLTNTREAMAALAAAGILSPEDYARLREAHIFLRRLINALRMVRGNARDLTIPPPTSEEFAFLARRLGYGSELARLQEDLTRHTTAVQELSVKLLG
ncbi:MAG: glutamine synthetase adenylyltransferase [Anaerolineae bacterium]|nr:glutamine synthetase adenylyltransferase [Anaerolineae bacterium]MDW8100454.1 glutamine synthetase adenylyltransferase [Anaerolineae bacterium]